MSCANSMTTTTRLTPDEERCLQKPQPGDSDGDRLVVLPNCHPVRR